MLTATGMMPVAVFSAWRPSPPRRPHTPIAPWVAATRPRRVRLAGRLQRCGDDWRWLQPLPVRAATGLWCPFPPQGWRQSFDGFSAPANSPPPPPQVPCAGSDAAQPPAPTTGRAAGIPDDAARRPLPKRGRRPIPQPAATHPGAAATASQRGADSGASPSPPWRRRHHKTPARPTIAKAAPPSSVAQSSWGA